MQDFKVAIGNFLKEKIEDLSLEEILGLIEIPPTKDMGDYAFPCFRLAKTLRKAPPMIAEEIKQKIEIDSSKIANIEVAGGYLNFFVNKELLTTEVLKEIAQSEEYGKSTLGNGRNIVIDFINSILTSISITSFDSFFFYSIIQ